MRKEGAESWTLAISCAVGLQFFLMEFSTTFWDCLGQDPYSKFYFQNYPTIYRQLVDS